MPTSSEYKTTTKVKELTRSKKHNFLLNCYNDSWISGSNWDGGSRTLTSLFNIKLKSWATGELKPHELYTLQEGDLIVETVTFCGKPATPFLTCRPEDVDAVKSFLGIT